MNDFLEFIKNNYFVFTMITIVLILALIGYYVEWRTKRDIVIKKNTKKIKKQQDIEIDEIN